MLSDRCFHCHGPDESHRKADLRLDEEQAARQVIESGALMARVRSKDPDEQMPPLDSHRKPLNADELQVLENWIKEGAPWGKHWAFEKPQRPPLPEGADHPIDAFVRHRLPDEPWATRSPPAPPHTRLRRVSFDLTGLPPTAAEVTTFEKTPSPTSWNATVDRLLNSPHHGERLAMWWLDAARYSDTDGYQGDAERTNWPWRDWVVQAFNANMPFDQFTREQFAGDLLPNATPDQKLATCFHRNHMTNGEGGRHPEESRIDYVIDRANTTGTVWLGLTLGCTQCHSHKFDPVSHEDYYRLFAFFNSIDEDGKAGSGAKPYLKYKSPQAERAVKELETYVAAWKPREAEARKAAEGRFTTRLEGQINQLPAEYRAWRTLSPESIVSAEGTTFEIEPDDVVQTGGPYPFQDDYRITTEAPAGMKRITGWKLEVFPHASHTNGRLSRGKKGEFILTNVKFLVRREGENQVRDLDMSRATADVEKGAKGRNYGNVKDTLDDDPRNGWTTVVGDGEPGSRTAVFELAEPLNLHPDEKLTIVLLQRSTYGDANIGRFRLSVTDQVGETVRSLKTAPLEELARHQPATMDAVPKDLRQRLLEQALLDDSTYQRILSHYNEAKSQLGSTKKSAGDRNVMVLAERKEARESHVLVRGVWDAKGETVQPGVLPAVLPWPADQTRNRLDLANWLVSRDNPLTARVIVNHLWQLMFGAGIVRTPGDFGLQGATPTHPDLLDWLAVELMEHDWDLRHILRLIATSATYQQSSHATPDQLENDPDNQWLARAPRFRLQAWMIRDHALQAAGLLNPALGGPPVKPWQPEGVWKEIFMGRFTYKPSVGPAQYRRTLYAYWRRSSAPTFLFDSAQRRVCEVGTRRTNTPLHALTLLNDTTLFEAARHLAGQALAGDDDRNQRLQFLARRILSRTLHPDEQAVLERELHRALKHYQEKPADAEIYVNQTLMEETPESFVELAAYTVVCSLLFNLDEAMTHE
ncbi:MAG: PSD1 and planctomycete cytochrome C domain-containing protein [Verrucomicrobiota bacterium]